MPILETRNSWTFAATASTGALKAYDVRASAQSLSFYVEAGPGCTATVNIQTRFGSSSGAYATLSTVNLSTGTVSVVQFLGPLSWVRPYCVAKTTGVLTVELIGN
jgi:hypothetical protein